jgi:hypothetical protein
MPALWLVGGKQKRRGGQPAAASLWVRSGVAEAESLLTEALPFTLAQNQVVQDVHIKQLAGLDDLPGDQDIFNIYMENRVSSARDAMYQ